MPNVAVLKHARETGFALASLLSACCAPVLAQETPSPPEDLAHGLAADAAGEAGELGVWAREVIDRALKRAGRSAMRTVPGPYPAPLPAERRAAGPVSGASLAGRGDTPEIIVFISLSVPAASWRHWADEAARIGAPLALRGVGAGGLRETAKRIGERLGGRGAGVAIDPRLFRLFGIERVPATVVAPGGVPPCRSRGCSDDPAPPHDLVTGNIGLAAALEAVAAEGEAGRDAARRDLERLGGSR